MDCGVRRDTNAFGAASPAYAFASGRVTNGRASSINRAPEPVVAVGRLTGVSWISWARRPRSSKSNAIPPETVDWSDWSGAINSTATALLTITLEFRGWTR